MYIKVNKIISKINSNFGFAYQLKEGPARRTSFYFIFYITIYLFYAFLQCILDCTFLIC